MATGGGFARSIDKGCDEFYDYCCASCSAEGKNVEAVNFCIECDEYFCLACAQLHHRFGKMKMHQILDETSMKARGPQQAQSIPTMRCPQHHANLLDTYCGKHDDVCCGTCVTIDSCPTCVQHLQNTIQQDSTGQNMFSNLRHISLSNGSTQLHIVDTYNGVITLGIHGDKRSQFTDPELKYAWGVCVGNYDEIFVCGCSSNNIFQISHGGRMRGVVLGEKDGIMNPKSLCWDRVNCRLIVTMNNTDNMKVFHMKKKN